MPEAKQVRTGVLGVALAAAGATSYGVSTIFGRDMADAGFDSATALAFRFAVAAVVLVAILRVRGAPLRPLPGERIPVLLLGAIGFTLEATLFYLALERGTAAACILLVYAYPAIVTVIELARGQQRLTRTTGAALALSVVGTMIVVAIGSDVSISSLGIVLALATAVTYAVYLVVSRELGQRTDAMTAACWVAIGATGTSLLRGLLGGTLDDPSGLELQLLGYGAATAAAFAFTFAALSRIGTSDASVVMTIEALATVVLAAVFLGEGITSSQAAGGAAILAAAGIIAWSHREPLPLPLPLPHASPRKNRGSQ